MSSAPPANAGDQPAASGGPLGIGNWELGSWLVNILALLTPRGATSWNGRCWAQDETGQAYEALGFYKGFGAGLKINPYLKLLPMLMGIGSPGTIQAVSQSVCWT